MEEKKIHIPTLQSITKLMDRMVYCVDRSKLLSDVFSLGAIAISNKVDARHAKDRAREYGRIIKSYRQEEQEMIGQILDEVLALCASCVKPDGKFRDWLGELYMMSETSSSKAGQFFTPYDVSKACAKMIIDIRAIKKMRQGGEILSISEPACGSGGMILATLDVLWNTCRFNYAQNCFVEASDIDARCVHMCYIQLSLAGVPAIIKQQDSLTRQLWDVWYTPAYLFQYIRFRHFEKCAKM